jgi:hypothetical protein
MPSLVAPVAEANWGVSITPKMLIISILRFDFIFVGGFEKPTGVPRKAFARLIIVSDLNECNV